jgi:hypothetical protein
LPHGTEVAVDTAADGCAGLIHPAPGLAVSRSLSSRAAQTLALFITAVLIAVLLVAPQPAAALG